MTLAVDLMTWRKLCGNSSETNLGSESRLLGSGPATSHGFAGPKGADASVKVDLEATKASKEIGAAADSIGEITSGSKEKYDITTILNRTRNLVVSIENTINGNQVVSNKLKLVESGIDEIPGVIKNLQPVEEAPDTRPADTRPHH